MNHAHSKTPTPAIEFHRGRPEFPSDPEIPQLTQPFEEEGFRKVQPVRTDRVLESARSKAGDRNRE